MHGAIRVITVAGNIADSNQDGTGNGGGLFNSQTGLLTLRNTVVALDVDSGGEAPDCSGPLNSQGYNLIQDSLGCSFTGHTTGNILGLDPRLAALANCGGATETRALIPGSPAANAGNSLAGCRDGLGQLLTTDQRGLPRPVGLRCDIGADEKVCCHRYSWRCCGARKLHPAPRGKLPSRTKPRCLPPAPPL